MGCSKRFLVALAITASALGVAHPGATRGSVFTADLISALERGSSTDVLRVFVHGAAIEDALGAVQRAGLRLVEPWQRIGVAVADGTPASIRRLMVDHTVDLVERDQPLERALDSAHLASGAEAARESAAGVLDPSGMPYDGSGITIAINDSGINAAHPMFSVPGHRKVVRNMRQLCPTYHTEAPAPCDVWVDMENSDAGGDGHGTLVASVAAGFERTTADGRGLRGVAPGASLVGLGSGTPVTYVYGAVSALNWVLEHHADPCGDGTCPPIRIVNNSLGFVPGFDPDSVWAKLPNALVADGVLVVLAAGNAGGDGSENRVSGPASNPTPGVLAVANYQDVNGSRDRMLHPTSSRGLAADPSTYPDLSAPGSSVTGASAPLSPYYQAGLTGDLRNDPSYATATGTSLSAPYVAGVAALLLQADPTLTPADIEFVLETTAYQYGPQTYVADPFNPSHSTSFDRGHGLVDVVAALDMVIRGTL